MNNLTSQTKRPSRSKNENAITLVALIITIIILIILAVVTINTLTHDGLADLAIKSTQDYQKAQSDEMNMLNEIDAFGSGLKKPTVIEVALFEVALVTLIRVDL